MAITLFNSLTGKKEEFKPIDPLQKEVGIYTCGPTVYNYAHIGNLRAYVFADVLRRVVEYNGYKVRHVMNITDVGQLTSDADEGEDKMVKALKREGKTFTMESMREVADIYTKAFVTDLGALNIKLPEVMPRASEHIKEDIEIIQALEAKGIIYKTSDGIYFDVTKFPSYGTRGRFKLGDLKAGARVAVNPEKKNQADFTLWKFSDNELGWESPWGKGFPGWHIECSAMSRKYLGQPFDIHTGGIDHIPTHHQNEIAQSESAYGVPLANYWIHNEFVNIGESKMAKSGENFLTLKEIAKTVSPLAYRYFLLGAKYSTPIKYDKPPTLLDSVLNGLRENVCLLPTGGKVDELYQQKFIEAVNDDLNTSAGLAVMFDVLGDKKVLPADRRATVLDFDRVFGLELGNENLVKKDEAVPDRIKILADEREAVRKAGDFKKADEIRSQLEKEGYVVMDTDSGPQIKRN